jgi:hypothetical protein
LRIRFESVVHSSGQLIRRLKEEDRAREHGFTVAIDASKKLNDLAEKLDNH